MYTKNFSKTIIRTFIIKTLNCIMYSFIDIHTHSLEQKINTHAIYNIIIGQTEETNKISSAGIHPWYIEENYDLQLKKLNELIVNDNIIAIGECGLDKLTHTEWSLQVTLFKHQINLAQQINKPIIIHCVKAYQEILDILKSQKISVPVIFHGFNKQTQLANSITKKGYYISLGHSIIRGKQDELIKNVDLNKIFIETDDKSTNLIEIYSYFCSVRNIELIDFQKQIKNNFQNIFNIKIT